MLCCILAQFLPDLAQIVTCKSLARTLQTLVYLKHLLNVETRFYCPQAFLTTNFQCADDVSESKYTLRDHKELAHHCIKRC